MIERLKIVTLNTDAQIKAWNLDSIAEEFDHRIPRIFPIHLMIYRGSLKGWFFAHQQTVVYPAFHIGRTSPRDFYDLSREIGRSFKTICGDYLVTVPKESRNRFTDHIMDKIGFEQTAFDMFKLKQ